MKIIYLSTARLPTEKAYGVTVLESVHAANQLGIEILVFAPGPKNLQRAEGVIHLPAIKFPNSLKKFNLGKIRKIVFGVNSLVTPLLAMPKREFRCSNYIWLRDPLSALMIGVIRPNKKLLLEIHHRPQGAGFLVLKVLLKLKNVSFSAISPRLIGEILLDHPGIYIFEAPMAVPSDFFNKREFKSLGSISRLIYVGKGQSSGIDNGLDHLLRDFSRAIKLLPGLSLTFLGLENDFKISLTNLGGELSIPKENIKFVDHIPHDEVKTLLAEHDIGVLPYPRSKYNNERFPIKSLEYAASELTIMASRIESHTELLGEASAYFYEPGVQNSFESVLSQIFSDETLRNEKLDNARIWSEGYTYEKRIQGIISKWLASIL
jgi:glycosyltransferase involved in cell wall biosynthesis